MKIPVVELSECILCGVCREVCPAVFSLNDAGFIQVADLKEYPENEVAEAIKNCPTDCIYWEDM
jgi:ferredoxin